MDNLKNKAQACMRIQKIEIRKLFNMFDYDIEIDDGNDVSVLIAPNGCGKTTIFNFISFILKPTRNAFIKICSVPFERFALTFSSGQTVVMQRKAREETNGRVTMEQAEILRMLGDNVDISIEIEDVPETFINLRDIIMGDAATLNRLGQNYREAEENYIDDDSDIDAYLSNFDRIVRSKLSELYTKVLGLPDIGYCFISANRLEKQTDELYGNDYDDFYAYERRYQHMSAVERRRLRGASRNPLEAVRQTIDRAIRDAQIAYNKKLDMARDNLLRRYLKDDIPSDDQTSFMKDWEEYSTRLKNYKDIGLIQSEGIDEVAVKNLYDNKGDFLKVYLTEFKKAIEVFEDLYPKLSLFFKIINKRNQITKKVISLKDGKLQVTCNDNPRSIPLGRLSSGEKNDIVMFFQLIFRCKKGNIVLIDEPEISLHISWQEEYIDRLLEICKQNSLQAIIATHSPNIINDHTDLIARSNMYYV